MQDQSGERQQSPPESETARQQNEDEVPLVENQPTTHETKEA